MSDQAWTPSGWQRKPASQQVLYPDNAALADVLAQLGQLPPLVSVEEIVSLKQQLADAAVGRRFLLQGGDCSESFSDCTAANIASKLKILLQMSLVLVHGCRRRVIRVGRFAGQYAKPRSDDTQTQDGVTLPSYRGDCINDIAFTKTARTPDPQRLLSAYEKAGLTLNYIRALAGGGFADLHHPEFWDLDFVSQSALAAQYQNIVDSIDRSIRFLETISDGPMSELSRVEFFASHEALHLPYEQALTRCDDRDQRWYNIGTHLPWIGERTRDLEGAHVEFARGLANPVGVKLGPAIGADELLALCQRLNPEDEPGKLVLIHRMGVDDIAASLPPLLKVVKAHELNVVWVCDPMHGNTIRTTNGTKTRNFDDILNELLKAIELHQQHGTILAGLHVELSGDNVTECLGGARALGEADLQRAYKSNVDPRLNYEQAMELALLIAEKLG